MRVTRRLLASVKRGRRWVQSANPGSGQLALPHLNFYSRWRPILVKAEVGVMPEPTKAQLLARVRALEKALKRAEAKAAPAAERTRSCASQAGSWSQTGSPG